MNGQERALGRILAWASHHKDESRSGIRGTMKLIYDEAEAALAAREEPTRKLCDACNVRPEWVGEHRCCGDRRGDPPKIPCDCQEPLCRMQRGEATLAALEAEDAAREEPRSGVLAEVETLDTAGLVSVHLSLDDPDHLLSPASALSLGKRLTAAATDLLAAREDTERPDEEDKRAAVELRNLAEAVHRLNVDWEGEAHNCGDKYCAGDCRYVRKVQETLDRILGTKRALDTERPAIETAARAVLGHAEYDDLYGHWRFEGKLLTDPDGAADDALTALEEALQ